MSDQTKTVNAYEKVWTCPKHFTAFGFGLGTASHAPGTWGTLLGIPLYLIFSTTPWWLYLSVIILAFVFGVWLCETVSRDIGVHDHKGIVWDEVVGMMLTLFLMQPSVLTVVLGFVFFRFFDIFKPWPISWADKNVKGGLGIMLDDIFAAVPAWGCLAIITLIF